MQIFLIILKRLNPYITFFLLCQGINVIIKLVIKVIYKEVIVLPLSIEEFNELMSKLNDPELSAEDRTEVLTQSRSAYAGTFEELAETSAERDKLNNNVADLTKANARLFNETGYQFTKQEEQAEEEEQQLEFSETVNLEDIESKFRTY